MGSETGNLGSMPLPPPHCLFSFHCTTSYRWPQNPTLCLRDGCIKPETACESTSYRKRCQRDVSQHTGIVTTNPTSLNVSTLNFLNWIIYLGATYAKCQVPGWLLAQNDEALLQQSVCARGIQTYFNINMSKTSNCHCSKKRKRENYMTYSNVKYECFSFSMHFSLPFMDI